MRIGAIIQARVSSTRLPGKILKKLPYGSDTTVLDQVISRLKRSRRIDEIIVATTVKRCDGKIVSIAAKHRVKCFRGSENDVLSRYFLCASKNKLDIIVRITSDCPCIDPNIVDGIIARHLTSKADYTSTTLERTYPRGLDAEVFGIKVIEEAYKKARKNYEREHVTPYIYMKKGRFKIVQAKAPATLCDPDIRITLDTAEDYALLSAVFGYLYKNKKYFGAYDIVRLFGRKPWLRTVNMRVVQKKIFERHI